MGDERDPGPPLPVHERPFTDRVYSLEELPDTPTRSFRIPATGWLEAPAELVHLGDDLDEPVEYKRRLGSWLLWRAGPPVGRARYMAMDPESGRSLTFDLEGRTGTGVGADGQVHTRFRSWKESLRDHGSSPSASP